MFLGPTKDNAFATQVNSVQEIPGSYLNIRYLFGAALILACLLIYSAMIPSVYRQGPMSAWENELAKSLYDVARDSPALVSLLRA